MIAHGTRDASRRRQAPRNEQKGRDRAGRGWARAKLRCGVKHRCRNARHGELVGHCAPAVAACDGFATGAGDLRVARAACDGFATGSTSQNRRKPPSQPREAPLADAKPSQAAIAAHITRSFVAKPSQAAISTQPHPRRIEKPAKTVRECETSLATRPPRILPPRIKNALPADAGAHFMKD